MSYTVNYSDPSKNPIILPALEKDTTSTSIILHGRGAKNYGEDQQENFLHLLENFASPTSPLHPIIGQLWFDSTSTVNKLKVYTTNGWQLVESSATAIAGAIPTGLTPPTSPTIGQLWFDTSDDKLKVFSSIGWKLVDQPISNVFAGTTAPETPLVGELWFDTNIGINKLKVYASTGWQLVDGTASAAGVTVSTISPVDPIIGQLWFDTNTSVNKLKIYVAAGWQLVEPAASTGISVGTTAPTSPTIGLLWFDTNTSVNKLKAYTPTGWQLIDQPSPSGVTVATTAPTSPALGALWFDSTSDLLKVYTSSGWQLIDQSSSGGIYSGLVAPVNPTIGQLWLDTNGDILKIYVTAGWQLVDQSAAASGIYSGEIAPVNPTIGQLWFDTLADKLKVNDSTGWEVVGSGASAVVTGATEPTTPAVGQLWFDTTANTVKVYTSNGWEVLSNSQASAGGTYSGDVEPASPTAGLLWYDTASKQEKVCIQAGSVIWSDIAITSSATEPATPLLGQQWFNTTTNELKVYTLVNAQLGWQLIDATSLAGIFSSATAPQAPTVGDFWFDSTPEVNKLKVYTSTGWLIVDQTVPGITSAATFDTKPVLGQLWFDTTTKTEKICIESNSTIWAVINIFSGDTAPVSPVLGQLWYDTVSKQEKVCSQAGTILWNNVTIFSGATAPTPAVMGRQWFDTANNVLKIYTTDWVALDATSLITLTPSATAPTGPIQGNFWFDSTPEVNKLKIYTSTGWQIVDQTVPGITVSDVQPTNGVAGQLWFDTVTSQEKICMGPNAVVWSAVNIFNDSTAPAQPVLGQMWFDPSLDKPKIYTSLGWRQIDQLYSGTIYSGTTEPANPSYGQLWFDPNVEQLKVYTTNGWELVDQSGATPAVNSDTFTYVGLTFKPNDPALNKVSWTSFIAYRNGDNPVTVAAGNATWTSGTTLYLYYVPPVAGNTTATLQTTTTLLSAISAGGNILATYKGGLDLQNSEGRAFTSGDMILAGTVGANQLVTNTAIITSSAQIGADIKSAAYTTTSPRDGWIIRQNGTAEFEGIAIYNGDNLVLSAGNYTGSINNVPASTVSLAVTNYNESNDRDPTPVVAPTISNDGNAIDHTISTSGNADISLEWSWSGNEADIDGFRVYIRQSVNSTAYTFGTAPATETIYEMPADKRAFILLGVAADQYYTFGVQAYRSVDADINVKGIIVSTLVKPSLAAENPYRPSTTVAFTGDISGTINGTAATTVVSNAATALTNATNALNIANAANTTASDAASAVAGKNKTYSQNTQPTSGMVAGDLWINTSSGNKLYRYSGSTWVLVQDAGIADAVSAANSKNKTFFSATTPTGMLTGDLWYDTTNKILKRYNGSTWDNTVLSANSAQGAGTPTGGKSGDSWFDTTTNLLWYNTNGVWSKVMPTMTSTNITTFMSGAAIGDAQIGSLSASKITTGTLSASSSITVGSATDGLVLNAAAKTLSAYETSVERIRFGNLGPNFGNNYGIAGWRTGDSLTSPVFQLDETGLDSKIKEATLRKIGSSWHYPVIMSGTWQATSNGLSTTLNVPITITTGCYKILAQVTGYWKRTDGVANDSAAFTGYGHNAVMWNHRTGKLTDMATEWDPIGCDNYDSTTNTTAFTRSSCCDIIFNGTQLQLILKSRLAGTAAGTSSFTYVIWALDNLACFPSVVEY